MTNTILNEKEVSFVVPIYNDWMAEDVWKLIKPLIYEDQDGTLHLDIDKLEVQPDGEPIGFTRVVIKDGKDYLPKGTADCNCDHNDRMCSKHWRPVSEAVVPVPDTFPLAWQK